MMDFTEEQVEQGARAMHEAWRPASGMNAWEETPEGVREGERAQLRIGLRAMGPALMRVRLEVVDVAGERYVGAMEVNEEQIARGDFPRMLDVFTKNALEFFRLRGQEAAR